MKKFCFWTPRFSSLFNLYTFYIFFSKILQQQFVSFKDVESIINKVRWNGRKRERDVSQGRWTWSFLTRRVFFLPLSLSPSQTTIFSCSYLWLLRGRDFFLWKKWMCVVRESQSCRSLIRKKGRKEGCNEMFGKELWKEREREWVMLGMKNQMEREERIDWHESEACLVIVLLHSWRQMQSRQWFDGYAYPVSLSPFLFSWFEEHFWLATLFLLPGCYVILSSLSPEMMIIPGFVFDSYSLNIFFAGSLFLTTRYFLFQFLCTWTRWSSFAFSLSLAKNKLKSLSLSLFRKSCCYYSVFLIPKIFFLSVQEIPFDFAFPLLGRYNKNQGDSKEEKRPLSLSPSLHHHHREAGRRKNEREREWLHHQQKDVKKKWI